MSRSLKYTLHRSLDRLYCIPMEHRETIGVSDRWTILTHLLETGFVFISAGVGKSVSFEREMQSRYAPHMTLLDPSPTGRATMQQPENRALLASYQCMGLGGTTATMTFSPPANAAEGSYSKAPYTGAETSTFPCTSVSDIFRASSKPIDLLKMDIEGFEYDVIRDIIRHSVYPRQLCVEFHHWMPGVKRRETPTAIASLLQAGYICHHKTIFDYSFVHKSALITPPPHQSSLLLRIPALRALTAWV